ncbi:MULTISPECIES: nuclear transport factor 2 family protein [Pandoraea]|uniref:DUF4440 domain-containing protein n=1 Tax=Pandoraea capi TaxID=2508286 RepID=A0ABY6VZ06_9BURK|nr:MULTISPECIES: nuclear transport factor 2 family protein [Pandoraea]ODP35790.1 DUF4440 domain-containing protein [Pandoraea sp. ISTKB]VVD97604.1 hypothetical protein PCA20602_01970 [Pandoraea capi]
MAGKHIDEVRRRESARFEAMIDGNIDVLETHLADGLFYVHSNGKRESKGEFLNALSSGRRKYAAIDVTSQELREFGDTVVVTGKLDVELETATGSLNSQMIYTAVHVLEAGVWHLISWQATRMAPSD